MIVSLYSTHILDTPPGGINGKGAYGGLETVAHLLCKYLNEQGHTVNLFATVDSYHPNPGHLFAAGKAMQVHPVQAWKAYWDHPQAREALKSSDVVCSMDWDYAPYMVAHELKKLCHVHHGPDPGFRAKPPVDKPNLIAVSFNHAKNLMKMLPGVEWRAVQNGIDLEKYPFKKEKEDYLLWVGRLFHPKGAHRFIDICEKMQMKGIICGGSFGDDAGYRKFMEDKLAKSKFVTVFGGLGQEISHEDKVKLYQNAKAVVQPSIDDVVDGKQFIEPFGLIVPEANACLPENEVVFSDYTPIKIKDVKEGDIVNSNIEQSVVLKKYKRKYQGKMVKIKPQGLLPVSFTEGHPILICDGKTIRKQRLSNNNKRFHGRTPDELDIAIKWKRARDISVGDYVVIPREKQIQEKKIIELKKQIKRNTLKVDYKEPVVDEEIAYLLGWYLAEGCSNKLNGAVEFNLNETDDSDAIIQTLKKYFGNPKIVPMRGINRIIVRNAPFCRWLLNEFGHGAANKKIPRWVIDSDENIVLKFLEGYIRGDGCVSKHHNSLHIQIKTASSSIAHTLVFLLAKIGVVPSISYIQRENDKYVMMGREVHQRDAFNIRIYGSELEKLIPNYKHKCIDHRRHLVFDDKILIPISNIVESTFDGDVYNLSTTDMTFLTPFVVHNCGTPTVVVPSGGWNESTAHGYNGFFANTDDEFCHFIRRIDEIHPEDCRKQAEHFDYKIMGKNYVKLFEEIIGGGGGW